MDRSEKVGALMGALLNVQRALRPIAANKAVEVDGAKAKWDSRYATYAKLSDACRPLLAEHGIVLLQGCIRRDGQERLQTILALGEEWIASDFPIKTSRDGAQGFGGGISFAKRWGLACMVGLVTSDDQEEAAGYRAETREPKRGKAPPGVPDLCRRIHACRGDDDLPAAAAAARAAHPTGTGAADVEAAIDTWFVGALDGAGNLDDLTALRDLATRVKPRGPGVRDAIRRAAARLEPPQ